MHGTLMYMQHLLRVYIHVYNYVDLMICIYRYDKYNIAGRPFHDVYKVKLPGPRSCLCIMPIIEWGYEPTSLLLAYM